jgi:hypothetical protein
MTVIGSIQGKYGQYQVFHLAPRDSHLYFTDSAGRNRSTGGFRLASSGNGYTGPDGSHYTSTSAVLSEIQRRYSAGRYD